MTAAEKVDVLRAEAAALEALAAEFPDVREDRDRWNTKRWAAKSATARATDVELRHSCGCCPDSAVYAMPYLTTAAGVRVYADPPQFTVGRKVWGDSRLDRGWEKGLREAGVPEAVVCKVAERYAGVPFADDPDPESSDAPGV